MNIPQRFAFRAASSAGLEARLYGRQDAHHYNKKTRRELLPAASGSARFL
jgi:hypothetical protein